MQIKKEFRTHFLLLGLLVAGLGIFWLNPLGEASTFCIFKTVTGIACPSCGTGHGLQELINGNFLQAWNYNPLSYIAGTGTILLFVFLISDLLFRKRYLHAVLDQIQKHLHFRNPITWMLITLTLLNWYRTISLS
jgi:hypothetical protein